ncbi:hypothetical protein MLE09_003035 [Klebsiella aerogenes]|nr:hypothetical protein [Klebsiella aerogenes]
MQRELSMRLGRILNNHIVNYPRCEVLVEILRECRTARDEAQAELKERRKADSEPVMYVMGMGRALDAETASTCKGAVDSWVDEWNQGRLPGQAEYHAVPIYRHAQPAPEVPDRSIFEKWWESQNGVSLDGWDSLRTNDGYCDDGIDSQFEAWSAAMLVAAPQEAK